MQVINYLNQESLLEKAKTIQFNNSEMNEFLNREKIRLVDIKGINDSKDAIINNNDYSIIRREREFCAFCIGLPMNDEYSASIIEFLKLILNN